MGDVFLAEAIRYLPGASHKIAVCQTSPGYLTGGGFTFTARVPVTGGRYSVFPAPALRSRPRSPSGPGPPAAVRGAVKPARRKAAASTTAATQRLRRTPTRSPRKPTTGGPARKAT